MLQQLRLILAAVQFFTRLPVPAWVGHDPQLLQQSARYLPLVGILVGGLSAFVLWLTAQALPLTLAVGLAMVASILVTGAFHEDGLADFADGMGGGHTREKILAIMKDPRSGSYGVLAIVLVLLLKYQALLALCDAHAPLLVFAALVAAHSISRLMAVSLMFTQHYVRDDDSARARPATTRMDGLSLSIAFITGLATLYLPYLADTQTVTVFAALAASLLVRTYLAWRLQKRLGGYTGDCLGAVQQLAELAFYFGLLAVF